MVSATVTFPFFATLIKLQGRSVPQDKEEYDYELHNKEEVQEPKPLLGSCLMQVSD